MNHQKKVALVTGASSGIGKSIAEYLIKEDLIVYGAARRVERMKPLEDLGGHALDMDVTNEASMQKGVDEILEAHGQIDILVNNAGYAIYGAVEDIPVEDARRQFEVNLFGLARLTQMVLPSMRKNERGRIINMSSMGGKVYTPLGAWYHATKHALEGWSDCLRLELKPFGIDVVIIEPGAIKTEFGDVMSGPLQKVSGSGHYAEMVKSLVKATESTYSSRFVSGPEVIAKLVVKAVHARRPKTRYVGGYMAKPVMFLRRWLSDRMFDKMVTSL